MELFSPGSLGTCWYGKYHYLEPWIGCSHNCPYCYAKNRRIVNESLQAQGAAFSDPELFMPEPELLRQISETAGSGQIQRVKLSRYTDILVPKFVENGLSYKILEILAKSPVERTIITTKGKPDENILGLFAKYPEKFSYNFACRPTSVHPDSVLASFDKCLYPLKDRLEAAARAQESGVKVTIHLDPIIAGIDDDAEMLGEFLSLLKELGLKRVMWSYLLFSPGIMDDMEKALGKELLQKILARYNMEGARKVLPGQEDTVSFAQKNDVALESVEKIAFALMAGGFEFVLCSLKSIKGLDLSKYPRNMLCDGKFYA